MVQVKSQPEGEESFICTTFPAPGLKPIQRHITTHNDKGLGVFLEADGGAHFRPLVKGKGVGNIIYSTRDNPVDVKDDVDLKYAAENEPGLHMHNGTVLRMIDFAPDVESPMHRALSVDYGVVLEGELELSLDSGEKRILRRGDCCVQRGTAHKWANRSKTEPARALFVLLDVKLPLVSPTGEVLTQFLGELQEDYEGR
ncbi:hypothetical protein Q9L58_004437 [Maublancomyces gigas]|uniref:Cupin type-2 domain-containing protein n=1 Tax=Discina gigas TaxID=1032678 RepID=A0ABR3GKY9_9PEZI